MKDIILEVHKELNPTIKVLDKGFVTLIDCMPRLIPDEENSADYAIAEAARNSYQRGTKTVNDDDVLIRYLQRHIHSSPSEMVLFKFYMKLPIFCARQIVRHRSASLNELSGRYSEMPNEYFMPIHTDMRGQSNINRQGSDGLIDEANIPSRLKEIEYVSDECFASYERNLETGMTREMSRIILPLSTYTNWYWLMDLSNLLHFLNLRCDEHAQKETRDYANAILKLIQPIIPNTIEAWNNYSPFRGGMLLTSFEIESLKKYLSGDLSYIPQVDVENKLERLEWVEKLKKIGGEKLLQK